MLPLESAALKHPLLVNHLLALGLGLGFGAVLEWAGLSDARRQAAALYRRDFSTLKVLLTAVLTTCLLAFLGSSLGWLDLSRLHVAPSHVWPGVLGGMLMGLGLAFSGHCLSTALAAAGSLKLDGLVFLLGSLVGLWLFGESLWSFKGFWNGSVAQHSSLPSAFGWSVGFTVVAFTLAGLALFLLMERQEGTKPLASRTFLWIGSMAVAASLMVWIKGQPTPEQTWKHIRAENQPLLDNRSVFINALDWAKVNLDPKLGLITVDLRPAPAFEAFHLDGARLWVPGAEKKLLAELENAADPSAVVLVADDEALAVQVWQRLRAQKVSNLYILEGGMAAWKQQFSRIHLDHFDLAKPSAEALATFPPEAFTQRLKIEPSRAASPLYCTAH